MRKDHARRRDALRGRRGQPQGSVADGTSFSDFEKEEKEHKHSIYSAVLHLDHQGKRINLIDTPGSPDLIGGAIACLPAVETVAVVVNAQSGIEVVTRRMMEAAKDRNLPRAIIVNKIDMPEVHLEQLVARIQETFGAECLPINLPTDGGKAVVDCLLNNDGTSDFDTVKRCHAAILDQIVEMDENLMEKYLGGEEPNFDALHDPFEMAMDEAHVVPILFTDAKTGVGVSELLDSIAKHFPSPLEGNLRPFLYRRRRTTKKPFHYTDDPQAAAGARVQSHDRPVRRQARGLPRPPGQMHRPVAGLHRPQQKADQARARLPPAGQGAPGGGR